MSPYATPVGVLACVVLLWATLLHLVERQHGGALHEAQERADAVARLAEENIRRTLDAAGVMHALGEIETRFGPRDAVQRAASPIYLEMQRLVRAEHFGFLQVAGIGPDGWMLWSTVAADAAAVDLSDRVHFREPMAGGGGLFIGEIVVGRVSKRLSMQISRRMAAADGSALGVVVGSFDPLSLLPFFADLGLRPTDEALLLRDGGMVLASSRGVARTGEALATEDPLRAAAARGGFAGAHGGAAKLVAVRRLAGVPLTVCVSLDRQEALQDFLVYRRDLLRAGVAATTFAFGLTLALGAMRRRRARLADAALQVAAANRSEARFRVMAETLGDLVLVHEPDGRISYASPAASRLLGRDAAALVGTTLEALTHPEDRPALVGATRQAAATGSALAETHRVATAEGGWAWLETAVERLEPGEGGARTISSSRDVGARLKAERALHEAHAQLNHLLADAPVVLFVVRRGEDGRWRLSSVSRSAGGLLGWSQEQALRPGWWFENVHPEDAASARAAFVRAVEVGRATHEYRFRRSDGEWRWLRDELRGSAGGGDEVVGCSVDVTEEHALRRQLVQASKLATLGEMATGMAHEMNQPLAVIGTAAEALLERCVSQGAPTAEQLRPKLERIVRMAHRAAAIIEHMRVFGRIDGGRLRPVSLQAAVQGALTIVGPRLALLGATLDECWEPGLPPVRGEQVPLEQVVLNLLTNACDAFDETPMPAGGRRIALDAVVDGGRVVLSMQDNAGGIPEAALAKVFEPFFTTKPVGKGTGLGLAISFGIVRDLGGTLSVTNQDGGARFVLSLPAVSADRMAQAA